MNKNVWLCLLDSFYDELFDKDANEISIVDVQENYGTEDITFYSLDVEDVDTYFSSDILVHNIPGKE